MKFVGRSMRASAVEGNALDRAITWLSPTWGARRVAERQRLALGGAAFRAASQDRTTADWLTSVGSADADLLPQLDLLRQRSREMCRNNPIAASMAHAYVRNVVGTGLRPSSCVDHELLGITPQQAEAFNDAADRIFARWQPFADAAGKTDFYGLQRLAMRRWFEDGDVFSVTSMSTQRNRPFDTQVEIVEADRVETPRDRLADTNTRAGIVFGRTANALRYWIRLGHPGDVGLPGQSRAAIEQRFRLVPAYDEFGRRICAHLFDPKRGGQTRGEPRLTPVMPWLRQLGGFLDAELIAQRIQACFGVVIKKTGVGTFVDPNAERDADGRPRFKFTPGFNLELGVNEDVVFADPKRPGGGFDPYVRFMLQAIGAGMELPGLEVVLLDFTRSNYSSARAVIIDSRRAFTHAQQVLVHRFCAPARDALLEEAWLRGELEVPGGDFYGQRDLWCQAEWVPEGWAWVDPRADAEASEKKMELGLSNRSIEARALGRDWEGVLRQKLLEEQREKEIREELGLSAPPAQPDPNAPPEPGDPGDGSDGDESAQQDQETEGEDEQE